MVMWFYSEKMLLNFKKNGLKKNCLSMFMFMVNILCYIFVIIK